ncbi:MAG: hypothetical protein D8M59_03710 [Planctomycetes bacterium]|nr:hypothetical protein [Planctomycetota bacterium]NOG53103.1 AAA family ATPase [Planctomycetota bacterium]
MAAKNENAVRVEIDCPARAIHLYESDQYLGGVTFPTDPQEPSKFFLSLCGIGAAQYFNRKHRTSAGVFPVDDDFRRQLFKKGVAGGYKYRSFISELSRLRTGSDRFTFYDYRRKKTTDVDFIKGLPFVAHENGVWFLGTSLYANSGVSRSEVVLVSSNKTPAVHKVQRWVREQLKEWSRTQANHQESAGSHIYRDSHRGQHGVSGDVSRARTLKSHGAAKNQDKQPTKVRRRRHAVEVPAPDLIPERWEITEFTCVFKMPAGVPGDVGAELLDRYEEECRRVLSRHSLVRLSSDTQSIRSIIGYPRRTERHALAALEMSLEMSCAFRKMRLEAPDQASHPRFWLLLHSRIHDDMAEIVRGTHEGEPPRISHSKFPLPRGLTKHARPDCVMVSGQTKALLPDDIEVTAIRLHSDDADPETQPVTFQVLHAPVTDMAYVRRISGQPTFTGRNQELGLLKRALHSAEEGRPQVVCVSSRLGMGRSRLLKEFILQIQTDAGHQQLLVCQCRDQRDVTPFAPVSRMIRHVIASLESGTGNGLREAVNDLARQYGSDPSTILGGLHDTLSTKAERDREGQSAKDRDSIIERVSQFLIAVGKACPTIVVVDAFHCADSATATLVRELVNRIQLMEEGSCQLMVIISFRCRRRLAWASDKNFAQQLLLQPLPEKQARTLISRILRARKLPCAKGDVSQLVQECKGSPAEIVQTLLGDSPPATWYSKVLTEINRTVRVRSAEFTTELSVSYVAQMAAILGRSFDHHQLYGMVFNHEGKGEINHDLLDKALRILMQRGVVCGFSLAPTRRYQFGSRNIYEHIYSSIGELSACKQHLRAVEHSALLPKEVRRQNAQEVARHYEKAGHETYAKAAKWWLKTAYLADMKSCYVDALRALHRVERLLNELPESHIGTHLSIRFYQQFAKTKASLTGLSDPEAQSALRKVSRLARRAGKGRLAYQAGSGVSFTAAVKGHLRLALRSAEYLLSHPSVEMVPQMQLAAYETEWVTTFHIGHPCDAFLLHVEGMRLIDKLLDAQGLSGCLARVSCLSRMAIVEWCISPVANGRDRVGQAITLADGGAGPNSIAQAYCRASILNCLLRDGYQGRKHAEVAIATASEHGLVQRMIMANIAHCLAEAIIDCDGTRIEVLEASIAQWAGRGLKICQPIWYGFLAERCLQADLIERGLKAVEAGFSIMHETQERVSESELWRLRGELLAKCGPRRLKRAEECLQTSRRRALEMQSPAFELRALLSWYRIASKRRKPMVSPDHVLAELKRVCGRFRRTYWSGDMDDARALIKSQG